MSQRQLSSVHADPGDWRSARLSQNFPGPSWNSILPPLILAVLQVANDVKQKALMPNEAVPASSSLVMGRAKLQKPWLGLFYLINNFWDPLRSHLSQIRKRLTLNHDTPNHTPPFRPWLQLNPGKQELPGKTFAAADPSQTACSNSLT